LKIENFKL